MLIKLHTAGLTYPCPAPARRANIERLDVDNFTPLLLAASAGHARAVQTLLNHGADIGATDKHDRTAISWCAQENNVGALEVGGERGVVWNFKLWCVDVWREVSLIALIDWSCYVKNTKKCKTM